MTTGNEDHDGRDDLTTGAMEWALGERLGGETSPDLRDRVHARLAVATAPMPRRSPWLLAAAALFGVGIVTAVAVLARPAQEQQARDPVRDATPEPPSARIPQEPVTVSSVQEIEALPTDTKAVVGIGIEDAEVRALLRLTALQSLELRAVQPSPMTPWKPAMPIHTLGDDGILLLTSLQSLRRVRLVNQSALTKRGFDALAALPQLTDLTVNYSGASDDDLAVLSKLPRLESLTLQNLWNIRQATIARIAGIETLRVLDLTQNGLLETDWLKALGRMTDLLELRLASVGFTNMDIVQGVDGHSRPEFQSAVTDELVDSLRGLRSLRTLDISYSSLTAEGRRRLQDALPQATIVDANTLQSGPRHVSSVAMLESLPVTTREVICEGLGDDAIPALLRLEHLEFLELAAVSVAPANGMLVNVNRIPKLSDAGLERITALKSLRTLRLVGQHALTKRGMDSLAGFPQLKELTLCWQVMKDDDLAVLSKLPGLERLTIRSIEGISQETMDRITTITSLRGLDLRGIPSLTNAMLRSLGRMEHLVDLNLNARGDFGFAARPPVSVVDDDVLAAFAGMRALRHLDIGGSMATPAGKQRLQALLPDLRIVDTTPSTHR